MLAIILKPFVFLGGILQWIILKPFVFLGWLGKIAVYFLTFKWFSLFYQRLNELIGRSQDYVGGIYEAYFTFYGALLFTMSAGACISFIDGIHGHCEGKVELSSPLSYFLIMLVCFFLFQTFLLVHLTGIRLLRLVGVGLCGHYLAYQTYGFWSLRNIDSIASCKPYAYANITYGYMWVFIPALILISICFFAGDLEYETEPESNTNY